MMFHGTPAKPDVVPGNRPFLDVEEKAICRYLLADRLGKLGLPAQCELLRGVGGLHFASQLDASLYLFLLFSSRDKTQGVIPEGYVPKATQTKGSHQSILILRSPRVRCAQIFGGQQHPLQKGNKIRKASRKTARQISRPPGGVS
jgi:hypothetical protein